MLKKYLNEINHDLAYSLAEFTTFVINKYDTDEQSGRNQILIRGVFAGASCGSLVEYAKKQLLLAQKYLSLDEIKSIKDRSK